MTPFPKSSDDEVVNGFAGDVFTVVTDGFEGEALGVLSG